MNGGIIPLLPTQQNFDSSPQRLRERRCFELQISADHTDYDNLEHRMT